MCNESYWAIRAAAADMFSGFPVGEGTDQLPTLPAVIPS